MKIVLAPDSYKGSLTAKQACEAMESGIRRVVPEAEIVHVPMADGGEGTAENLVEATGGRMHTAEVTGPDGERVSARFGVLGDGQTAVIEMAEASGLVLVPEERRNPLLTTTYGTGELIREALNLGCRRFILGLGGSATNDGGMGMAQALGYRFLDENGRELGFGGGCLGRLRQIDVTHADGRLRDCQFFAACDVSNPLCGPEGASRVFAPQKGAAPAMVEILELHLRHFARVVERDLGVRVIDLPGGGAAGGLGAGAVAFLGASLARGVDIVIEAVGLKERLRGADLAFTGEGQCDFQTVKGKTPFGVAKTAKTCGVPVVVIAGALGPGAEKLYEYGVQSVFSLTDRPMTRQEAMANAGELLASAAERIMRLLQAGERMSGKHP